MINLLFSILDKIDSWISLFLSFKIQTLLWGIIAGSIAFIIYWLLSNQASISDIKDKMKTIRKKMFDSSLEDKSDYNSLAKKNLSLSFKLLGKISIPALISILPVVIIAMWLDTNYSYNIPFDYENIAVNSVPADIAINIEPYDITFKDINGNNFVKPLNKSDAMTFYVDDVVIYSGKPFAKPIPYITKKKWWNIILSSPIGYLSPESKIDVLIFNYPENVLFNKMPHLINGWELLFFVGIFISALPLRIIFKVQ